MDQLTEFVLKKYNSVSSHAKVLGFTKSFLKYLTKTRLDTRYYAFAVFLDRPRTIVERKNVTSRIVTRADIECILKHVDQSEAADQSIPSGALSSPHPIWRICRTTIDGHYSTTHDGAVQRRTKKQETVPSGLSLPRQNQNGALRTASSAGCRCYKASA